MDIRLPPLSIFDSKQGKWLERKKYWNDILPDSLEGRKEKLCYGTSSVAPNMMATSRFDPTLTEVIYSWFIPDNCKNVCDPFSGGNTRGIIAELLGYKYTGFEVRKEQFDIDIEHSKQCKVSPNFIHDTSLNILKHINKESQDLIFTCPPYYNLEKYSNQENDISNCGTYDEFLNIYKQILKNCYDVLQYDRFFILVVSEVRNKDKFYYGFVPDTINILKSLGLKFYNDAILINSYGTAHIRIAGNFKTRKLVRVHQNVLIFYKGNVNKIENMFKNENMLIDKKQVSFI